MLTKASRSAILLGALLSLTVVVTGPAHAQLRQKEQALAAPPEVSLPTASSSGQSMDIRPILHAGLALTFLPAAGLLGAHAGLALSKRPGPPPLALGIVDLTFAVLYAGGSAIPFSENVPELGAVYMGASVALLVVGSWTFVANARHEKVSVALGPGGFRLSARFH